MTKGLDKMKGSEWEAEQTATKDPGDKRDVSTT